MSKRDAHGRMLLTVSKNTGDIIDGIEDLSSWSDEELARGQRRSKNGNFVGKPPNVVPRAVHDEIVRRRMDKAYELLRTATYDAVALLHDVVTDLVAPLPERLKAAQLILDRTLPKNEKLNVNVGIEPTPKFIEALQAGIISVGSGEDDEYIDAEIIE
jgi:hypothetical protein